MAPGVCSQSLKVVQAFPSRGIHLAVKERQRGYDEATFVHTAGQSQRTKGLHHQR